VLRRCPIVVLGNPADQLAEASRVNRADLLNQDSGVLAE
jgi:hypothetical protein